MEDFSDHPLINLHNDHEGLKDTPGSDQMYEMQMTMKFTNSVHHLLFKDWAIGPEEGQTSFAAACMFLIAVCFVNELLVHLNQGCKRRFRQHKRVKVEKQSPGINQVDPTSKMIVT